MKRVVRFIVGTLEWVALIEGAYYVIHDYDRTLHGDIWDALTNQRNRHRAIRHTRNMIRELPEL